MQNDSDPVIAAVFQNELDAHVAAASLKAHGIDVRVMGGLTANFAVEVPGATQLLVPRSQCEAASTLLQSLRTQTEYCTQCGRDLRQLSSNKCPECEAK